MLAANAVRKLKKAGFLTWGWNPDDPYQERGVHKLVAYQSKCKTITGMVQDGRISAFYVEGDTPDKPEVDHRDGTWIKSLAKAILVAVGREIQGVVDAGRSGIGV